ncbi:MAG: metallophosphoesterase family protein [Pirellulales bacterium]
MLLGLISDTHGHVAFTLEAVRMLREFDVALLLHCGDIGTGAVVEALAEWPTHYVFGNCDRGLENSLRGAIERAGHTCHERFGELELDSLRIAWLHGDDERRLEQTIAGGQYHVVCSGHTHVAKQSWVRDTLAINPGAVFRANPRSVAVLDLPSRELTTLPLS